MKLFKKLLSTLFVGFATIPIAAAQAVGQTQSEPVVIIDSCAAGLIFYYPPTDSIALRCFNRPEPSSDFSIVFCCAAAFTLDYGSAADHKRICSSHVSDGHYYKKPKIKRYTGAFAAYGDKWGFRYQADADPAAFDTLFQIAADNHGCGFAQEMMIHESRKVITTRPLSDVNLFRSLCERNGKLCVADATHAQRFGDFIQSLLNAGVTEALYTDMGYGWNYSWYRTYRSGPATYIHSVPLKAATNWLVFYAR